MQRIPLKLCYCVLKDIIVTGSLRNNSYIQMFLIQSYFLGFQKRFTVILGIFLGGFDSRLVVCARTQSFD